MTPNSPNYECIHEELLQEHNLQINDIQNELNYKKEKLDELKKDNEKIQESLDINIVEYGTNLLEIIQKDMYNRALERRNKLTFEAHNLKDIENILNNNPGFIHGMWCGNVECENKIKEIKGCKSRCIVEEESIDENCVCCGKKAKYHVIWGIQY